MNEGGGEVGTTFAAIPPEGTFDFMPMNPLDGTASRRAALSIRKLDRDDPPGDDLSASTSPEQRITLVWELTQRMWALTGRAWPDIPRDRLPIRITRPT